MKLSSFFKKVGKAIDVAAHQAQPAIKAAQAKRMTVKSDGFEVARAAPVSLGKQTAASAASDGDYVKSLYRDLLGREPDIDGFHAHMNGLENGMTRDEIKNVFLTSPEFREKQEAAAVIAGQQPSADPAAAPTTLAPRTLGPVPLEGYDAGKLANFDHTTVKYQFGRVATNYPLDSVKDKASAEALLKSMVPDLKAAGLNVMDVKGDRILVQTELGHEWVDVVRGAGSGKPGWWWGSEGKAVPGTEGMAGPKMVTPLGPLTGPNGTTGTGTPGPTGPTGGTSNLPPLSSVPDRPEYHTAPIDKSSPSAAALSAAVWVKNTYPQLFARADDRAVCVEIMTHVIGALRAAGYDATRVVNHSTLPPSNPVRWGSDAVVLDGHIFDVYRGIGDPNGNQPQAMDAGPYEAGRLRE